jgi:hypothetical protein
VSFNHIEDLKVCQQLRLFILNHTHIVAQALAVSRRMALQEDDVVVLDTFKSVSSSLISKWLSECSHEHANQLTATNAASDKALTGRQGLGSNAPVVSAVTSKADSLMTKRIVGHANSQKSTLGKRKSNESTNHLSDSDSEDDINLVKNAAVSIIPKQSFASMMGSLYQEAEVKLNKVKSKKNKKKQKIQQ